MSKVHKTPLKLQLVRSCINSFSSIFSAWDDFGRKPLHPFIPLYTKDSKELLQEIKHLEIPPGAKIFTVDASIMYTNINTAVGTQEISNLFTTHENSISPTFLKAFFLLILETIMYNNIITVSDTYWLQLQGTAMDTPAAPNYSLLPFGHGNNQSNLFFYKRYIYDIFGTWINTTDHLWESFKAKLDPSRTLIWNIENLTMTITFLDINLN